MSQCTKRTRQLNIQDFFSPFKRVNLGSTDLERLNKNSCQMEAQSHHELIQVQKNKEKAEMRELLASAAEKRIARNDENDSCATETSDTEENDQNSESLIPEENNSDQLSDLLNSDELFSDWNNSQESTSTVEATDEENGEMVSLNSWPKCKQTLPVLQPSEKHTILFRPHLLMGCAPQPYPDTYRDRWDSDHVRMPCSPFNQYPVGNDSGEKTIQSRWDVICTALRGKIKSSTDLENAIMQYNKQYLGRWDFRGLHIFLNEHLDPDQKLLFFEFVLPGMINLALDLPKICTKPIPLLKKHMDHSITISQKQIACLLANAFFCTYPRRNHQRRFQAAKFGGEYSSYPDINFNRLYNGNKNGISRCCEKLRCILNYFSNVIQEEPTGTVTFHRQCLTEFPNWSACKKSVKEVVVRSKGFIEDEGQGMLQIDFANRFVGGGVLGQGCVQEEIRFVISPELIISRLFTESLTDAEALIITGIQRYSKYKGYGDTFQFDGNFQDNTPRDTWGRRFTQVVAIDALHFHKSSDQFKMSLIKRELNKAYSGFYEVDTPPEKLPAVATGNWGCGAFKGSPYLKFLIQLMAASAADRDMMYFSFGDKKLQENIQKMHHFVRTESLSIGDLWTLLEVYCTSAMQGPEQQQPALYDYIYSTKHCDGDECTRSDVTSKPKHTFVWPNFT